ncbi:asparagine synthase, partial [Thamnocephalis sphaerospora]
GRARMAILFSGGIDCMCLAMLADRYVALDEPIDLINVAFENPRSHGKPSQAGKKKDFSNASACRDMYEVPDRKTGQAGLAELCNVARPGRRWNFIRVNVPYADASLAKPRIVQLMSPANTLMDMSIAMALWFAASASGGLHTQHYTSPARVLLSGLGADELFGGYTRHREGWRKAGWLGLIDQLQLDLDRISSRNLGRDDRIISDHAREVRFPFLDEAVIAYACTLPVHIKVDPRWPRGVGEKLVLRAMAALALRLNETSTRWKRAIQFGARTAKMESGR